MLVQGFNIKNWFRRNSNVVKLRLHFNSNVVKLRLHFNALFQVSNEFS